MRDVVIAAGSEDCTLRLRIPSARWCGLQEEIRLSAVSVEHYVPLLIALRGAAAADAAAAAAAAQPFFSVSEASPPREEQMPILAADDDPLPSAASMGKGDAVEQQAAMPSSTADAEAPLDVPIVEGALLARAVGTSSPAPGADKENVQNRAKTPSPAQKAVKKTPPSSQPRNPARRSGLSPISAATAAARAPASSRPVWAATLRSAFTAKRARDSTVVRGATASQSFKSPVKPTMRAF